MTALGFISWPMVGYDETKHSICVLGIATSAMTVYAFVLEKETVTG